MPSKTNPLALVNALVGMGFLSSYELFTILSENPFLGRDLAGPVAFGKPVAEEALVALEG